MHFIEEIRNYIPINQQEIADQAAILTMLKHFPSTILSRENAIAHITSSGFIINAARTQTLLIHHNLYQSWGWTGGHADGDGDLLQVALREAREETGVHAVHPLLPSGIASLDILPVFGHKKNGSYVNTHLHLSIAYLLIADEAQPLCHNPKENSAARWVPLEQISHYSTEAHMLLIYAKLIEKVRKIHANKYK